MAESIKNTLSAIARRIQLNLNVAGHIVNGRWLSERDIGRSYDQISPNYNSNWLSHLRCVTDRLLSTLPNTVYGKIADLGCGTGYTTEFLAGKYPQAHITGVDISEGMLEIARKRTGPDVVYQAEAMLEWLEKQENDSHDLILSAWAIGYSYPDRVIREASRVLKKGGHFLFVVNFKDTLEPVFRTYRQCMRSFPHLVNCVVLPRFPSNSNKVRKTLRTGGFSVVFCDEGKQMIKESAGDEPLMPWLLDTGVLAGFDTMMPLRENHELQQFFEKHLRGKWSPLHHHYIIATGQK